MKRLLVAIAMPLLLAACQTTKEASSEIRTPTQMMKSRCSQWFGGDYAMQLSCRRQGIDAFYDDPNDYKPNRVFAKYLTPAELCAAHFPNDDSMYKSCKDQQHAALTQILCDDGDSPFPADCKKRKRN